MVKEILILLIVSLLATSPVQAKASELVTADTITSEATAQETDIQGTATTGTAIDADKQAAVDRVAKVGDMFLNNTSAPPQRYRIEQGQTASINLNLPENGMARYELIYSKSAYDTGSFPTMGLTYDNQNNISSLALGSSGDGWAYKPVGRVKGYEDSMYMTVLYLYSYQVTGATLTMTLPDNINEFIMIRTVVPYSSIDEIKTAAENNWDDAKEPTSVICWSTRTDTSDQNHPASVFTADTLWSVAASGFRQEDLNTADYLVDTIKTDNSGKKMVIATILIILGLGIVIANSFKKTKAKKEEKETLEAEKRARNHAELAAEVKAKNDDLEEVLDEVSSAFEEDDEEDDGEEENPTVAEPVSLSEYEALTSTDECATQEKIKHHTVAPQSEKVSASNSKTPKKHSKQLPPMPKDVTIL